MFNYLIPVIKNRISPRDHSKHNEMYYLHSKHKNKGWDFFVDYAHNNNIPLLVYLHGEKEEALRGEYNQYGRWLAKDLEDANIPILRDIYFKPDQKYYRDFIHFNKDGQQFMATLLEPVVLKSIAGKP